MDNSNIITVRKAESKDAGILFQFIEELAEFERAPHEVTNTPERIIQDGFGDKPAFTAAIAEYNGEPAGIYVWYIRYSTWKGRGLYLEDIIVSEKFRGKGIGRALMKALMEDALEADVHYMTWQVLDWNEPAIEFYGKYTPVFDGEWINVRMSREQIEKELGR
jgi:GNAT superfamily N-acetyltransferase